MNKRIVYWGIILLVSLYSCTSKITVDKKDQARNDSIGKYLELAGNDTIAYNKKVLYNDKALTFVNLNQNDSLTRWNLYFIGVNNYNLLQFKKLDKNSKILSNLSFKSNNQLSIAISYKLTGLNEMCKSKNEQAIESFSKAKKIFLKLNATKRLITLNKDIAQVQFYSSDFLGSNKTLFENLKRIKILDKNLNQDLYRNYATIADNFLHLKDYKNSIKYKNESIKWAKNNLKFVNYSYLGIADSYIQLKKYDDAQYYIDLILKNPKSKFVSPQNFYNARSMHGYLKLVNNKMNGLPDLFYEVEDYFFKNDDSGGQDDNQIYLSIYYEKLKDNANAIKAANKALNISKSYKNPSNILLSLEQLIKVDKKNASKNAQEYIMINDSMQIAERSFRDKFARIAYETDEITQEKDKAISQKWIVTAIAAGVILFVLLIHIITRQRAKQKELQLLQEQQKANEEIYELMLVQKNKEELARQSEKKRIALELHDGVMNKLASTRLNLNVLTHRNDPETIEKCLTHIAGIYEIEQEIRNISHDLTMVSFTDTVNSFVILLNDFIKTQKETYFTDYKLEMDETINWERISSSIKMNIFRIIQEASHNVNKFAQAKNATISLVLDKSNICLSITDDGKGFDPEASNEGIGLKNIKQRVETLNGKIVIQSITYKSTSINIAIPLPNVTG
ncbi:ATP-binding protein [Flavobacterium sp.]|uniref:sensor histidine kinase n=1 Tax=Flavobacterium sp. TaxID=239 RepID=UPI0025F6A92A|nr:ATP-binding protein [Flavobacterium sp.]